MACGVRNYNYVNQTQTNPNQTHMLQKNSNQNELFTLLNTLI